MGLISRVSSRTYRNENMELTRLSDRYFSTTSSIRRHLRIYIFDTPLFQLFKHVWNRIYREYLQLTCGDAAFDYKYSFQDLEVQDRIYSSKYSDIHKLLSWPLSPSTQYNFCSQFFYSAIDNSWL